MAKMHLLEIFEKGNYSEVINYWDQQQFQISQDPDSAFIAAASHFRIGNLQKACEICELLEGPFSNNASFLSMYAVILRRLNLFTRAEEIFKQALSLDPDSKEIKNNYSNLLIDQKKYDQALDLLNQIISVAPDYNDAKLNLERCKLIMNESESIEKFKNESNQQDPNPNDVFGDPLEQAFSTKEVSRLGGKIGQATASVHEILFSDGAKDVEQAELEMIRLATDMVNKKQYESAISILSEIRKKCEGLRAQTYKLASDAFIGLERFKDAEIFALIALQNNERTTSLYINLASFAAMRKDQVMAKYWLIEAEKIDPNNENLNQCKDLLFPGKKSREEDLPFKI